MPLAAATTACISTMMSIFEPTAARIFSNGSSPFLISSAVMS